MDDNVWVAVFCKKCDAFIGAAKRSDTTIDVWIEKSCPHRATKDADWELIVPTHEAGPIKRHPSFSPALN